MMADYIKDALKQRINELENEWLDDLSRDRTIEKLNSIIQLIAYPVNIMDNKYLNGLYDLVRIL